MVISHTKNALELQIYIDGFPLRELDIRWLREEIGLVEQVKKKKHIKRKLFQVANTICKLILRLIRNLIFFTWTSSQTSSMAALETSNRKI